MDRTGELAALGTAVCWTVTAMAFEAAGKRVGSAAVNLIRLVWAVFALGILGWLLRGLPLPLDATRHAWIWLSISGLVGFAIGDLCLFRAFVVIGSRISMLLMALAPPMAALTGWLLMGETLALFDWLGMALTVAGVSWVVLERKADAHGEPKRLPVSGIALGLAGAAGQAIGLVLSKYGMGDYDPFAATQIRVIAGIASFAVLFTIIRRWQPVVVALRDGRAMASTGLGAFFGPFLGVSLSLVAVQHTEAGVAATLMALVPVLIIAPSALVFRDRVSLRAVLGAAIAVGGCTLLFL